LGWQLGGVAATGEPQTNGVNQYASSGSLPLKGRGPQESTFSPTLTWLPEEAYMSGAEKNKTITKTKKEQLPCIVNS
jgi:hypothetical protein